MISVDYVALLCVVVPLANWGVFVALAVGWVPADNDAARMQSFFLVLAIVSSLIGLPLLFWRLRVMIRLVRLGVPVSATVSHVWFSRDRGRIDFSYTYQGESFSTGVALSRTETTEGIRVGQRIEVLIDPANPKRAIVPHVLARR